MQLTEKESAVWNELSDQILATTQIRTQALQYYLQYRQKLQQSNINHLQHLHILFQIAFLVSEKNQPTYNMRGQRVAGVALSINDIIKKNANFEDFIYHMKQMLKVITIQDPQVQQQIESCLKKFKFTMTFHHKHCSTFHKLSPNPTHPQITQSLLWLLFISSKQTLPLSSQCDIIDITCLIACVFMHYAEELIKFLPTGFLELDDAYYGGVLRKDTVVHVFLEYFRLKDMTKFGEIMASFNKFVRQTCQHLGVDSLFADKNLESVYRKLDSMYMKKINEDNIDERLFLRERINNVMNANRFTPFGGRRVGPNNRMAATTNQILSHRTLNYQKDNESLPIPSTSSTSTTSNRDLSSGSLLLKKLSSQKTPTSHKTPLIQATPMTNAMQMYNWLLEKTNYHKYDPVEMNRYLAGEEKQLKMINGLWKDICLSEEEKGVVLNDGDRLAVLVLAAEVVYFVANSGDCLDALRDSLKLTWFDVWAKVDAVLTYDLRMPTSIKMHMLGLETVLISKNLFSSSIPYINCLKSQDMMAPLPHLHRRMLHQLAYQAYFLSKKLSLPQQLTNTIFMLCQYTLTQHPDMLLNRSLYHIVLCSIYGVCKVEDLDVSFYKVLVAFKELNNLSKNDYCWITEAIYVEGTDPIDIIAFYNEEFVKRVKPVLIQLKYEATSAMYLSFKFRSALSTKKNVINSPVKELLGKNVVALGDRTNKSQPQTPMTLALQAYHESPLLRQRRIKNLSGNVDGKRLLQKKPQYSKQQAMKQTSMLINQKWRTKKSPQKKQMTTVKKTTMSAVQNSNNSNM